MSTMVRTKSVFSGIPEAPPDPIISLNASFRADPAEDKLNLGVGAYRTNEGKPYILPVVKKVQRQLLEDPSADHEYLPIEGLATFRTLSAQLILGEDNPVITEGRTVTVQSLSGTGALRVGMEFLAGFYRPGALVLVPDPTWPVHNTLPARAGLSPPLKYRYFNMETKGVDFAGMMADISSAPDGSIVVLHPCAHNPTGADLTPAQWQELLGLVHQKSLLPFFDCAYQGFASGDLFKDRYAVELFSKAGLEMLIAQSYAKNMGLYGERVGALSVIVSDSSVAPLVLGQLKMVIRTMYSSPPSFGAQIAARVLADPKLFTEWQGELKIMSGRITEMRQMLVAALKAKEVPGSWDFINQQIGMFSYTGLSAAQVEHMRKKFHIYMTKNGRISMAGLTTSTVDHLATAINDAVRNVRSNL